MKPKYEHYCDNCIFLGHFLEHDLYVCIGPKTFTFLWRSSDEEPEYGSGANFVNVNELCHEAAKRAVERGLITKERIESEIGREFLINQQPVRRAKNHD